MSMISEARAQMDMADYVLAVMVEQLRASEGEVGWADSHALANQIKGSRRPEINVRCRKMMYLGVLDRDPEVPSFRLTIMGVQLMEEDVDGFVQSTREQRRREKQMVDAVSKRA